MNPIAKFEDSGELPPKAELREHMMVRAALRYREGGLGSLEREIFSNTKQL